MRNEDFNKNWEEAVKFVEAKESKKSVWNLEESKNYNNYLNTVKVAYLYTVDAENTPVYVQDSEFVKKCVPILIVETKNSKYVRELSTDRLIPTANVRGRSDWEYSYIDFNGTDADKHFVIQRGAFPFERYATVGEVYYYLCGSILRKVDLFTEDASMRAELANYISNHVLNVQSEYIPSLGVLRFDNSSLKQKYDATSLYCKSLANEKKSKKLIKNI